MNILVTGGAGYIGSHTCVELLKDKNNEIIVVDNLSNSKEESLRRVEKITNRKIKFYKEDILNTEGLEKIFQENKIDSVIHFAGLKAVGESVKVPLKYYQNNITGTISLLEVMKKYNCRNIVFSSSATVYGDPKVLPLTEECEVGGTTNPYGTTKYFIERILMDLYKSDNYFNIAILRYFNPVGAHPSGLMGEDPNGIPNNLVPYITQVMVGKLQCLNVFGNDYNTVDGTGVRDYIHVCDLAYGHVLALNKLMENPGLVIYNLGTGNGYSVLQVLHAFEKVYGNDIPYVIKERRPGDIDACYADTTKAFNELGFKAQYDINVMAADSWRWQKNNPNGYED